MYLSSDESIYLQKAHESIYEAFGRSTG